MFFSHYSGFQTFFITPDTLCLLPVIMLLPDCSALKNIANGIVMTFAQILTSFLIDADLHEEIIENEEGGYVELSTCVTLENQRCRVYVRGDEDIDRLYLTITLPFLVSPGKERDACMFFNFINDYYMYPGRIMVDANRKIRYKEIIDTEQGEPSADLIQSMLSNGSRLITGFFNEIATVCVTEKSYESVLEAHLKKEALKDAAKKRRG